MSVSAIQNIQPILNAISLAEAQLFSKLNNIESEIENISCGGATSIAVTVSAIQNIQPILNAISLAEAQIFSKLNNMESEIEALPFGATTVAVNILSLIHIYSIIRSTDTQCA